MQISKCPHCGSSDLHLGTNPVWKSREQFYTIHCSHCGRSVGMITLPNILDSARMQDKTIRAHAKSLLEEIVLKKELQIEGT